MGRPLARFALSLLSLIAAIPLGSHFVQKDSVRAQSPPEPSVVDRHLGVRTVANEFEQPIGMTFLGPDDYFVLEKASGRVWRVMNGARTIVLDLPVNSASERGLLSASAAASAFDCRLDEGSTHPCLVAGVDIGPLLYVLGVSGWLMLVAFPLMLLTLLAWAGLVIWAIVGRLRRRDVVG